MNQSPQRPYPQLILQSSYPFSTLPSRLPAQDPTCLYQSPFQTPIFPTTRLVTPTSVRVLPPPFISKPSVYTFPTLLSLINIIYTFPTPLKDNTLLSSHPHLTNVSPPYLSPIPFPYTNQYPYRQLATLQCVLATSMIPNQSIPTPLLNP